MSFSSAELPFLYPRRPLPLKMKKFAEHRNRAKKSGKVGKYFQHMNFTVWVDDSSNVKRGAEVSEDFSRTVIWRCSWKSGGVATHYRACSSSGVCNVDSNAQMSEEFCGKASIAFVVAPLSHVSNGKNEISDVLICQVDCPTGAKGCVSNSHRQTACGETGAGGRGGQQIVCVWSCWCQWRAGSMASANGRLLQLKMK